MPKIFSKDCKIKVIEYGASTSSKMSWTDLKTRVQNLIPTANAPKAVKKSS